MGHVAGECDTRHVGHELVLLAAAFNMMNLLNKWAYVAVEPIKIHTPN
jgi:hypothetical protein